MDKIMLQCESDLMCLLSKSQKTIDDCLAISQLTMFISENSARELEVENV